ncbi:MAG: hypothetical protein ISR69_15385 [Gammaproteobacteria bacterium]|nr:hypothetical protein [Gammaproteobacteria bacterium]
MKISLSNPFLISIILFSLSSCSLYQPSNPNNICSIFSGETDWYLAAKKSQDKWGVSIPNLMATMKQESHFVSHAQPKRKWFLWVIPLPRESTAYGYAQAQDPVWEEYTADGHRFHVRDNFADAINFIGWYMHGSSKTLGISKTDIYSQYLAYHEGRGGFKRKTYNKKPWLTKVAQNVKRQSIRYSSQLKGCKTSLENTSSSWFW